MKVEELRIGNYVGFKNRTDLYCEVVDICKSGHVHVWRYFNDGYADDQPELIDDITGIPLTEEWMIEFGFTKIDNKQEYFKPFQGRYHSVISSGLEPIYKMGYSEDGIIQVPIYHVHQLQNLYFALTGNELNARYERHSPIL